MNVAVVGAASRIGLPASIWAHTQGNPIDRGDNWLKAEEYVRPVAEATPSGGQTMAVAYASDYAQVTVTGARDDNLAALPDGSGPAARPAGAGPRSVRFHGIPAL